MEHWNNDTLVLNSENEEDDENDEVDEDDYDNDEDNDNKFPNIKEKMTSREYRQAVANRKNQKYRFARSNNLWIFWHLMRREYLPDFFIKSADINKQAFTLYDIICYLYILWYGKEEVDLNKPSYDILNQESLNQLATHISSGKNKIYNSKKEKNHFQAHKKRCLNILDRFFTFIFEDENSISQFQQDNTKLFNVLDYGFFSYLLNPKNKSDVNNLLKEKYNKVSSSFYYHINIGLKQIVEYHDVKLSKTELDIMYKERFGIDPKTFRPL